MPDLKSTRDPVSMESDSVGASLTSLIPPDKKEAMSQFEQNLQEMIQEANDMATQRSIQDKHMEEMMDFGLYQDEQVQ